MTKLMLGVIVGVFAGAFAKEILARKRPGLLIHGEDEVRRMYEEFREAFWEAYETEGDSVG